MPAHTQPQGRIKLACDFTDTEAMALAQLCKRFTYEHARALSSPHDAGRERDAMLDGILSLQRALADAGFAPR
jgi:hypothetical protein